jgi:hypothetical protein
MKNLYVSLETANTSAFRGTVDGQIKLGQKWQSHKSKFTNLHRLITDLSQIG